MEKRRKQNYNHKDISKFKDNDLKLTLKELNYNTKLVSEDPKLKIEWNLISNSNIKELIKIKPDFEHIKDTEYQLLKEYYDLLDVFKILGLDVDKPILNVFVKSLMINSPFNGSDNKLFTSQNAISKLRDRFDGINDELKENVKKFDEFKKVFDEDLSKITSIDADDESYKKLGNVLESNKFIIETVDKIKSLLNNKEESKNYPIVIADIINNLNKINRISKDTNEIRIKFVNEIESDIKQYENDKDYQKCQHLIKECQYYVSNSKRLDEINFDDLKINLTDFIELYERINFNDKKSIIEGIKNLIEINKKIDVSIKNIEEAVKQTDSNFKKSGEPKSWLDVFNNIKINTNELKNKVDQKEEYKNYLHSD